jgi:hypothetical protein
MTADKPAKKAVPPLSLPERPPSKVEQGLKGTDQNITVNAGDDEPNATVTGGTPSADELRERAIEAMVAAGLSREFAEASFVLKEDDGETSAADVADAVGELDAEDFGAPLCPHGCHGPSWRDIPAERDAVGCEHGSFSRKPSK